VGIFSSATTSTSQAPPHERPSTTEEEPPTKRQKTEEKGEKEEGEKVTTQLVPEAEWRSRISVIFLSYFQFVFVLSWMNQ
jgi:hypothetical protein